MTSLSRRRFLHGAGAGVAMLRLGALAPAAATAAPAAARTLVGGIHNDQPFATAEAVHHAYVPPAGLRGLRPEHDGELALRFLAYHV